MRVIADFSHPSLLYRSCSWARLVLLKSLLLLVPTICRVGFAQDPNDNPATTSTPADTPQVHLGAGYEDLKDNRYEAAAREFSAALALDPKLIMQAQFPLAVALFELHQNDASRHEFEAVRREAGDHLNIEYYLGRIDLIEGKLDAAIQELNKAVAQPPFPDTAYHLGSAYLKRHDLASAEKWLNQAAELAPRDSEVQYRLGLLYTQAGRKEEAERAYARSDQLKKRDAEVDKLRLDCAQRLDHGSLEDARPVCEQLYDPDDTDKLTILGTLYGEHRDYAEALRPLRRAAELNPNSPQTQYNLAYDYAQLHRYGEAREPLAKAVERWPDLFPLNALFGAVLYNLGEESLAYQALHHAHELNPQDSATVESLYHVTFNLAQESVASKQYAAALRYLSEAARLRPQDPDPHGVLSEAYDATGRRAEAAEERRQRDRLAAQRDAPSN